MNRLNRILGLSLGVLILAGLYLSRKPLCIDSRVVERLDRIEAGTTETAWSCSIGRDTTWSSALFRRLPRWEKRIAAVEETLWRIDPFKKPLHVVVLADRPWAFRLNDDTLFIGDRLIEAEGHLERAIAKQWLRERDPNFESGRLETEVATDLVFGMVSGALNLEDPTHQVRTRTGSRWPLALKDAANYCSSPWKLSEHYELCLKDPGSLRDRAWRLSLRPLLASATLSAWWDMPLSDRLDLYRRLPAWSAAGFPVTVETPKEGLESSVLSVQAFRQAIQSKGVNDPVARVLAKGLGEKLRQAGFNETDDRVSLDILVLSEMPLETSSTWFQQMAAFAAARPSLKIAVKDPAGLTLLPSRARLMVDGISELKASRVAVLRCGRFDFDWVLSFEGLAQRLFVVDACGSALPDLRAWVANDAEGFATMNKNFRFIQFHLPSLAARKDRLNRSTDVLTVVEKRDVADPVFRTLGWQELNWEKNANAYHPRAQLDAIEWFRIN